MRFAMVALAALMVFPTSAQEIPTDSSQFATALDGVPYLKASFLRKAESTNPNFYIHILQGHLGIPQSGILTQPTIAAINAFCRENGIMEDCRRGPLHWQAARAIANVIEAQSLGEPTEIAVNDLSFLAGDETKAGVTRTLVDSQPGRATIRLAGTATDEGSINIPLVMSDAISVLNLKFVEPSVSVAVTGGDISSISSARLRSSLRSGENEYIGEAFRGVGVAQLGADPVIPTARIALTDIADDAAYFMPYLQIRFEQGQTVDLTLEVRDVAIITR